MGLFTGREKFHFTGRAEKFFMAPNFPQKQVFFKPAAASKASQLTKQPAIELAS